MIELRAHQFRTKWASTTHRRSVCRSRTT